jgi:anthranilate phosphoribosyltransferase
MSATLQGALQKVARREHLAETEAEMAMGAIMAGEATPAQIGGFLMALRVKGETIPEITGSARAMRAAATAIPLAKADRATLVDTCGTGGDGSGTFNISTTVAFVVAGAGLPVAKHGNRGVSSKSGSADVLGALGVNLSLTPDQVGACIDEVGIGFLFAPSFPPAMKHAIGPRRELATRTIFNILGPLTNPAGAKRQLMGVFDPTLVEPLAHVLKALGAITALVVHGAGGLDELTTAGPNTVAHLRDGAIQTYELDAQSLGLAQASVADLAGGDPAENAHITRGILAGQVASHKRDVVLLNAAAALLVGGAAPSLEEGIVLAGKSIGSGAALAKLEALIAFSGRFQAPA